MNRNLRRLFDALAPGLPLPPPRRRRSGEGARPKRFLLPSGRVVRAEHLGSSSFGWKLYEELPTGARGQELASPYLRNLPAVKRWLLEQEPKGGAR